jgi:hypothetical protein
LDDEHSSSSRVYQTDEAASLFGKKPCYKSHIGENAEAAVQASRDDSFLEKIMHRLPETPLSKDAEAVALTMKTWDEYLHLVRPRYGLLCTECGCLPPSYRVLSEFLSRSLTIFQALKAFNLCSPKTCKSQYTIHIVGAYRFEASYPHSIFAELPYLLPKSSFHIDIIGPDCVPDTVFCSNQHRGSSYPQQIHHSERLTVTWHPCNYHECKFQTRPDLVVAFHAGLHEYPADWLPTLETLISSKIPTVITAFHRTDMLLNCEALQSVKLKRLPKLIFGPSVNDFHSLCPLPPVVSNSYWLGFKGSSGRNPAYNALSAARA